MKSASGGGAAAKPGQAKKPSGPSLSGNSHLENSALNLLSLRDHARERLTWVIRSTKGSKKHLLWEPSLFGLLNTVMHTAMLVEESVVSRSGIPLDLNASDMTSHSCDALIFVTLGSPAVMKAICHQLSLRKFGREGSTVKSATIAVIPRKHFLCDRILRQTGFIEDVQCVELALDVFPIDSDLLLSPFPSCLRKCLRSDYSDLFDIARSLHRLQLVFGRFSRVNGKGDWSCAVLDILERMTVLSKRGEDGSIAESSASTGGISISGGSTSIGGSGEISELIVLDRTIDPICPLLMPRTYEALLDEVFTIDPPSLTKVSFDLLGKSAQRKKPGTSRGVSGSDDGSSASESKMNSEGEMMTMILNSSDNIFSQVRDVNFAYLGPILGEMASAIAEGYDARHHAKTAKELNDYMKRFKNLHSDHGLVESHIHMAEYIASTLTKSMQYKNGCENEQLMLLSHINGRTLTDNDLYDYCLRIMFVGDSEVTRVLSVLIIWSLSHGGIPSKKYAMLKKEVIQCYGLCHVITLDLLEMHGWITSYDSVSSKLMSLSFFGSSSSSSGGGSSGSSGGGLTRSGTHIIPPISDWSSTAKSFDLMRDWNILKSERARIDHTLAGESGSGSGPSSASGTTGTAASVRSDLNVVGSGYAPLLARLVECAVSDCNRGSIGWQSFESELKSLKGRQKISRESGMLYGGGMAGRVVLVYVIGGITYAEMSAMRMLQRRTSVKLIVCSTQIVNGKTMLKEFIDVDFLDGMPRKRP